MPPIEVYTTPFCPYCDRAKALRAKKGIAFEELDAPHGSQARKDAISRSGGRCGGPQAGGPDPAGAVEGRWSAVALRRPAAR